MECGHCCVQQVLCKTGFHSVGMDTCTQQPQSSNMKSRCRLHQTALPLSSEDISAAFKWHNMAFGWMGQAESCLCRQMDCMRTHAC